MGVGGKHVDWPTDLNFFSGPPFGGFMYEFFGKTEPFLILACLALGNRLSRYKNYCKLLANVKKDYLLSILV